MYDKQENKYLTTCPLSKALIRHPVLAAAGENAHHFEAQELLDWFLTSVTVTNPINGRLITAITYDFDLKHELDQGKQKERYQDYDGMECIRKLEEKLSYRDCHQAAYKSITSTNLGIFLYALYSLLFEENESVCSSSILLFMFTACSADYILRYSSNDKYSFFSIANNVQNYLYPENNAEEQPLKPFTI